MVAVAEYADTKVLQRRFVLGLIQFLPVVDKQLFDRHVAGAKTEGLLPFRGDGQACCGNIGLTLFQTLEQLFKADDGFYFQINAKIVGKFSGQIVFKPGWTALTFVERSRTIAGDDAEYAVFTDLIKAVGWLGTGAEKP